MKTFLSIGSGPGIGTATAVRFARQGFRIVLTSRDTASLVDRAKRIIAQGHQVETRTVDAGDLASVSALVRDVETQFGAIDVLHFNSASMRAATIETQAADTFVPDLTVNIGAALVAVQDASRGMLARGAGTILLTGGMFAVAPKSRVSVAQHRQGGRPLPDPGSFRPLPGSRRAYRVGQRRDDGGRGLARGAGSR